MKLNEFAELMGVTIEGAERMLQKQDVIEINLNNEKIKKEKEMINIIKI